MRNLQWLLFLLLITSCRSDKISQEHREVPVPKFNQDSAYAFIEKQVDFGPRSMNSVAHEDCKNWISNKLRSYGFEITLQSFSATSYDNKPLKGTNIIARHNPDVLQRILICAHYDTRHIADKDTSKQLEPIAGADDGGSGVGVILEIARQISINPFPMGVDVIFFDAEDCGSEEPGNDYSWGLGSQHWSKNVHEQPYEVKYGILLDMVGSKNASFPKEGFSMQSAQEHVNRIWNLARQMGREKYFVDQRTGFITDDHRFIIENTDIQMIDIINVKDDGKFGDYHHTHADNMDIIDKQTLEAVGQVVLATLYRESNNAGLK